MNIKAISNTKLQLFVQDGVSGWNGVLAAPRVARARNTGGEHVCNTPAVRASTKRLGVATCSLVKVMLSSLLNVVIVHIVTKIYHD